MQKPAHTPLSSQQAPEQQAPQGCGEIMRVILWLTVLVWALMGVAVLAMSAWGALLAGDVLSYTSLGDAQRMLMVLDVRQNIATPLIRPQDEQIDWQMAWSPDGAYFLFTSNRVIEADGTTRPAQSVMRLHTARANGRDRMYLAHTPKYAEHPTWSPDGRTIAYTSNRTSGQPDVYVVGMDGGRISTAPRNLSDTQTAREQHLTWSPDGRRLLYAMQSSDLAYALIQHDLDTDTTTRITDHIGGDQLPAWSPDGESVAFVSLRYGRFDLFMMRADGRRQRHINLPEEVATGTPQWSPDSAHLFVHGDSGALYIYTVATGRIRTFALADTRTFYGTWSPDGTHISFVGVDGDGLRLWVLAPGSGQLWAVRHRAEGAIISPQWQPYAF